MGLNVYTCTASEQSFLQTTNLKFSQNSLSKFKVLYLLFFNACESLNLQSKIKTKKKHYIVSNREALHYFAFFVSY